MWLHFSADPDNSFRKSMVSGILTRVGDTASISCLATDPSLVNLRLETCSGEALASGLQFSASLEQGIVIHNTQKDYEGCYVCAGMLREQSVRSHKYHLTVKPGKRAQLCACACRFAPTQTLMLLPVCSYLLSVPVAPPVIEMHAPKRVILTLDENLSLTCNTTNVNGEIKLNWVTPPGSVSDCWRFAVLSVFYLIFISGVILQDSYMGILKKKSQLL